MFGPVVGAPTSTCRKISSARAHSPPANSALPAVAEGQTDAPGRPGGLHRGEDDLLDRLPHSGLAAIAGQPPSATGGRTCLIIIGISGTGRTRMRESANWPGQGRMRSEGITAV